MSEDLKHLIDFGAIGSSILALLDFIPHLTALLGFFWISLRIYGELVDRGFIKGRNKEK